MIVAGFGCRSGASEKSLRAALGAAQADGLPLSAIATLTHKQGLLRPLADSFGLPLILIDPQAVEGIATVTHSSASIAAYRTGSVAEAVALTAAGPGAHLVSPRAVSPDGQATCALAKGASA